MAAENVSRKAPRWGLRPRISEPDQPFATVLVGKEEKKFVLHEKLLVHYSGFFRAALTGKFKEAEEKVARLLDDDADVFEMFVHWLYHGDFPDRARADDAGLLEILEDRDSSLADPDWLVLLYLFGQQDMVDQLQNETLNALFDLIQNNENARLPSPTVIDQAWEQLPDTSPMKHLLVEMFCQWGDAMTCAISNGKFIRSIWLRFGELHSAGGIAIRKHHTINICDFHDHKTRKDRKACKSAISGDSGR
ncbi:hypothetical protein ACN47E_003648 [Coniothyrium glycines]